MGDCGSMTHLIWLCDLLQWDTFIKKKQDDLVKGVCVHSDGFHNLVSLLCSVKGHILNPISIDQQQDCLLFRSE